MQIYNVNFIRLMKMFTIIMLRTTVLFEEILKSCTVALTNVHTELMRFRNEVFAQMQYTPQICSLRKLLNDKYDRIQRRIYIIDGVERNYTMMYRTNENKPLMMSSGSYELINRRDNVFLPDEFLVVIPTSLSMLENKVKTSLNQYKLVTKKYKIRYENL